MAENKPTNEQNDWLVSSKRMFNKHGFDYNRIWQKVHIGLCAQGIALDYDNARRTVLFNPDMTGKNRCSLSLEIFEVLRYHDFAQTGMAMVVTKFVGANCDSQPICACKLLEEGVGQLLELCQEARRTTDGFLKLVDFCTRFKGSAK